MESKLIHRRWFLYLTEFFAGMSIMAVELGASRRRADPPAPGRIPAISMKKEPATWAGSFFRLMLTPGEGYRPPG